MIGGGGDSPDPELALTAIPENPRSTALAAPESGAGGGETQDQAVVGKELELESRRVTAGQPIVVRYEVFETTQADIDFAGTSDGIELAPGKGRLEIGTEDVDPGSQALSIVLHPGGSLHTRVLVGG